MMQVFVDGVRDVGKHLALRVGNPESIQELDSALELVVAEKVN